MIEANATILLADDNEPLRTRLARALIDRGYRVACAVDGEDALRVFERERPRYAVIDLKMPRQSGLEVIARLLAIDPGVRIVVLTGYGSIATAIEAMRLGVTNYLTKPVDADDVVAAFETSPQSTTTNEQLVAPSLARAEWEHINRVLSDCGGNVSHAAERLGMHRRTLQRKLAKYPPRS